MRRIKYNFGYIAFLFSLISVCSFLYFDTAFAQNKTYPWLESYDSTQSITRQIAPPDGFTRVPVDSGSFAEWLRNLPLTEGNPPIRYYDGGKKSIQAAKYAVIDIDVGDKDLQQCADAVIRLRAEYLYSKGQYDSIAFNFTSGDRFVYSQWLDGKTPIVNGNKVTWVKKSKRKDTRHNFRKYLEILFTYAGSFSLSRELISVNPVDSIRVGDIFIEGGFPGHAMIVVDMAANNVSREKRILLSQSYMPAQNIHIVKIPPGGPWFRVEKGDGLWTLEWVFDDNDLMRFK